ncbi:MAG: threonine dehydratase [Anaerolineae bacterium SM23_ 63]|nr:MAG: threonine dehydratase [Anaerolineae bacterium SM23_ 63]HEY47725.1 hydroxyectoine utilization dehydratase EutB [Anaerolineae bacterium]
MPFREVTLNDIREAHQRIKPLIIWTPLVESQQLSDSIGAQLVLKLESLQVTGSFKARGAANKLTSLSSHERERGVITVSSGNHGRAVAYVARELGIHAVICLSEAVPPSKVEEIQALDAEVLICGRTYDEAAEGAQRIQRERGLTMVHPFDDPTIIAGQGTVGLELMEDIPQLDTVIVPLSGGGLISGIALALKSMNPSIQVIGVTMERGPAMYQSLRAGKIVEVDEEPTLADALAGGIGFDNAYTFRMVQRYVDDTLLVSEDEIAGAMAFALEKHRLIIEGGGAVGIASILYGKIKELGERVAVVVSGGNVELTTLFKIAREQGVLQ